MTTALIAGGGSLPVVIAERLAKGGETPVIYTVERTDGDEGELSAHASAVVPVKISDVKAAIADMMMRGVKRVILAGWVPKISMYDSASHDDLAKGLLASLASRDDHSLLGGIVRIFETAGMTVAGYDDIVPDLMASEGHIAGREASPEEMDDVEYGIRIARAVVPLSFGQSVIVCGRSVVAVEAMEGTDSAVARAGELSHAGVLVKMMKPGQDVRYDIPTVGPTTLEGMARAGLTCLALHAGHTLIMDRERFDSLAEEHGIAVLGFDPDMG